MKTNQNLPTDKRVSGRSKKMGLSTSPEFCEKLRSLSFYERRLQIEILEEALELYDKRKKTKQQTINIYQLLGVNNSQEIQTLLANRTLPQIVKEINLYRQTIPAIEQQMQAFQGSMSWSELEARMNNLTPIHFNKINLATTYQVLKESLSECLRLEREKEEREKAGFTGLFKK